MVTPPRASHADALSEWREGLPPIVSERFTLRELLPADAAGLHRVVSMPETIRHIYPPPGTLEEVGHFIDRTRTERAAGKYICYGIVSHTSHAIAGLVELRPTQPDFYRAELGIILEPQFWGTGLFPEAARLICEFAFEVLGVHRIEARASVENDRSNAALRKIGARQEGVLRQAFLSGGRYIDQYLWSIVNGLDIARPSAVQTGSFETIRPSSSQAQ
jgi:ribosomal-protein-alanine N-acetyltransferase